MLQHLESNPKMALGEEFPLGNGHVSIMLLSSCIFYIFHHFASLLFIFLSVFYTIFQYLSMILDHFPSIFGPPWPHHVAAAACEEMRSLQPAPGFKNQDDGDLKQEKKYVNIINNG